MKEGTRTIVRGMTLLILLGLAAWHHFDHPAREPGPRPGRRSATSQVLSPVNFTPEIRHQASGMVSALGLSPAEQKAVDAAITAKVEARNGLLRDAFALFEVATDAKASDRELSQALGEYQRSRKQCQRLIDEADHALTRKISLRARARLLSAGILDNGLGFMAGQSLSTAGMARPQSAMMPPRGSSGNAGPE